MIVWDHTLGDHVDLYTMPAAGGAARQLTRAPAWEWRATAGRTPREVVFLDTPITDDGKPRVVALDLDTGAETTIADVLTNATVVIGDAVYYVRLDGSEIRRVRGGVDEPGVVLPPDVVPYMLAASPDGARIAVLSSSSSTLPRLCVADLARNEVECLEVGTVLKGRPAFSTDSAWIYYAAPSGIRRHRLADDLDEPVIDGVVASGGIAISSDGQELVWSDCATNGPIYDVTATPKAKVVDEQRPLDPAFGPDGQLAWIRSDATGGVVMVRDRDGKTRQVTNHLIGKASRPAFDASGTLVAFMLSGPRSGIHVVPAGADSLPQQITDVATDDRPTWTADGRIAFMRWGETDVPHVMIVDRDGGEPQSHPRPRHLVGVDREAGELLLYSLDGTRAYRWDPATGKEKAAELVPPIEGVMSRYIGLSPSGTWVVVQAGPIGGSIYRVRREPGAQPERIFHSTTGDPLGFPAIDDNGRVVAAITTFAGELHAVRAGANRRF